MTKPIPDTELAWVAFNPKATLSSSHQGIVACAATETVQIFVSEFRGLPVVVVKDPSLPDGMSKIPWDKVCGFGEKS